MHGRTTKPCRSRPNITVNVYIPTWPATTEKSFISMTFDITKNITPPGDSLKKKQYEMIYIYIFFFEKILVYTNPRSVKLVRIVTKVFWRMISEHFVPHQKNGNMMVKAIVSLWQWMLYERGRHRWNCQELILVNKDSVNARILLWRRCWLRRQTCRRIQ